MNPVVISFLIFAGIFSVGLLAMRIRSLLPEHHLDSETKDTVKLAMALVATMTALLLGLMIASAKSTYDAQKTNIVTTAAKLVVLDRMLVNYGSEAAIARAALNKAAKEMTANLWPDKKASADPLTPDTSAGDGVYDSIQRLSPQNDSQHLLKSSALSNAIEIGTTRWLLVAQSGSSISVTLLIVVISWLAILFFSFGLFAPSNSTAICTLMVAAVSVAGAIFLILELDQPFEGLIQIPSNAMKMALAHLGK